MGKVFSWEDVQQKHIPNLSSFDVIGDKLKEELSKHSFINGALMCGSFLKGDHNRRSDIDCVVLYDFNCRKEAVELFQKLNAFSESLYVPLELIPLDTELAGTPYHHLTSAFIDHLNLSSKNGGVIKQNPMDFVCPIPISFVEDTRSYLINKIRKLEKGSISLNSFSNERLYAFLDKALALPIYAARKMIRCHGRQFINGDSKKEVLRIYPSISVNKVQALLEDLVSADLYYSELLNKQLLYPDTNAYKKGIEEIKKIIPLVLDFARLNLFNLAEL